MKLFHNMTFAIGDIHGEVSKLKSLVSSLLKMGAGKFIFIGDYINKGENSKLCLEFLLELSKKQDIVFLMGNHEYMWLEFFKDQSYKEKLIKYTSNSTLIDFSMDFDNAYDKLYLPYKNFFDSLKPYYETEKYFISHAGIDLNYIDTPLSQIPIEAFLFSRYDFISLDKKINNKISIFGHTGFTFPYVDAVKIGIDTSAVYAKEAPLTAYCLEEEFFINSNNHKKHLKECDLNICPMIIRVEPYRQKG